VHYIYSTFILKLNNHLAAFMHRGQLFFVEGCPKGFAPCPE